MSTSTITNRRKNLERKTSQNFSANGKKLSQNLELNRLKNYTKKFTKQLGRIVTERKEDPKRTPREIILNTNKRDSQRNKDWPMSKRD
jgi:hypothetical protein